MTFHPRSDWTSTTGTCTAGFGEVQGVAVHWNGTLVTRPAAEQLELDRRYHLSRGWCDIAYNLAVDQAGGVWECRGLELRSSANGSLDANRQWVAVVGLIGQNADGSVVQEPTPEMVQGFRDAVALVRGRYPNALRVATHNQVRPEPTACPGPDLTVAVRDGILEPLPDPPEEQMARIAGCTDSYGRRWFFWLDGTQPWARCDGARFQLQPGALVGDLVAVPGAGGKIDLYGTGLDGKPWVSANDGSGWSQWSAV